MSLLRRPPMSAADHDLPLLVAALARSVMRPLYVVDHAGQPVFANDAWRSLAARANSAELAELAEVAELAVRAAAVGVATEEGGRVCAFGAERVRVLPLRDAASMAIGALCTVQVDVPDDASTLRLRLAEEQSLHAVTEHARAAQHALLTSLSHALRSPLNTVRGWSDLLVRTPTVDVALLERAGAALRRAVALQTQLLDDVADVARLVHGSLRLERQRADVGDIVSRALLQAADAAAARQVNLPSIAAGSASGAFFVEGDENRLQQVVRLLLSNAVRYTPENGTVQVALSRAADEIVLTVRDTGVGIAPERLPHVLNRFPPRSGGAERPSGTLGIGLFLASRLVELHGGSVAAASDGAECGASFTVRLPRAP